MSNFSTVHDLLLHNQHLHHRIAGFYRQLSEQASEERVTMLLNVLGNHQNELSTSLRDYIDNAPAKIRDTYFQYDHEHSVEHLFAPELVRSQISRDDVETLANRFDQYFVELYQEMAEVTDCGLVRELFENLHLQMLEGRKRLSLDTTSMIDM